jgi:hypothetical protein
MVEDDFEEVEVRGIYIAETPEGSAPVVVLQNRNFVLPIYIGISEAMAIHSALESEIPPRPMTHDLFISVLEGLNASLQRIVIDDLEEGIFYARVILRCGEVLKEFDARPSDSIALALRANASIYVSKSVMERAGIPREDFDSLKDNYLEI